MDVNSLKLDLTSAVYRAMDALQTPPTIEALVARLQQISLRSGLYLTDQKAVSGLGVVESWVSAEHIIGGLQDIELNDGKVMARYVPVSSANIPAIFRGEDPLQSAPKEEDFYAMFFGRDGKQNADDVRVAYFYYAPNVF